MSNTYKMEIKQWNGTDFDKFHPKTEASIVVTTDGSNVEDKLNNLFQSANNSLQQVSNGKDSIYNAVVGKGITPSNKDFSSLTTAINNIPKGQGNAVESQVLSGITFSNKDGVLRTGTIPNNYGNSIPAFTYNSTTGRINVVPSFGYYNNGAISYIQDGNFKPENIVSGKSIFGLNGIATAQSLGGRGYASGNSVSNNEHYGVVTGLTFKPSIIQVIVDKNYFVNNYWYYIPDYSPDSLLNVYTGGRYACTVTNTGFSFDTVYTSISFSYKAWQ